MDHETNGKNKAQYVQYVGDSRVRANRPKMYPKDYSEFPGKTEAFFPNFLLREWMVAVVVLVGFMALVLAEPAPLGDLADPTNTSFVPLPDWYFLFLYQLLKYEWSSGPLTPIGTLIIPGIAFGALILAPWLDKGPERRPSKRPVATGLMLLAIVAIVYLTWAAADGAAKTQLAQEGAQGGGDESGVAIVDEDSEGHEIYKASSCVACHATDMSGGMAPPLLGIGEKYTKDEIVDIINNGIGGMPPQADTLDDESKEILSEWLAAQKAGEGESEEEGEEATE